MGVKQGTKEAKIITTLMKQEIPEIKINIVSRVHRFHVVIKAKGKHKKVFGGIGIFQSWKPWTISII